LEDEKDFKIENIERFLLICERDAKFLEDFSFMDYSLFVVKIKFDENSIAWFESFLNSPDYKNYKQYIYKAIDSPYSYNIFCIIDYLQIFDLTKSLENRYKMFGNTYDEIPPMSCVPPNMYSFRFVWFLNKNFK